MRRAVTLAVFAALSTIAGLAPAFAETFSVPMDEVRILTFKKPVSTVYVGNTVIVDATLIDSKHAFLLGKTMGETNVIALGADGNVIANDHITIFGRRVGMVTLNRGASQYNFTCTSVQCETQPVPGDPLDYFKNTHDAIQQHEDMANKAAGSAGTGLASNAGQ
jgi:hypothetical protein